MRIRLRGWARNALLLVLGRPIKCADCGRRLFVGLPVVWRGRVRLIGAEGNLVRVSFRTDETVEFRHVELDQCPAPERPWVR